jgi:putative (di)nucleoside polyphosphate hydrolase
VKRETASVMYRPNVAAIIRRADGKIFLGERLDVPGCWQFPQGGVKNLEMAEEALAREILEETSLQPHQYRLVEKKGPYRYLFPNGRSKEGFRGQEQTYFLVNLTEGKSSTCLVIDRREFGDSRWIDPDEFQLHWIPEFKRAVYRQVFRDFFGIAL